MNLIETQELGCDPPTFREWDQNKNTVEYWNALAQARQEAEEAKNKPKRKRVSIDELSKLVASLL